MTCLWGRNYHEGYVLGHGGVYLSWSAFQNAHYCGNRVDGKYGSHYDYRRGMGRGHDHFLFTAPIKKIQVLGRTDTEELL
jgi:hypothetical protein